MNKINIFKITMYLLASQLFLSCSSNENSRSFQFIYEVDIAPTNGKKLEMWLPYPQSNEVQTISNIKINTNGLSYSIEDEKVHNNKYIYIKEDNGIDKTTNIKMIFDVRRIEHKNVKYNNVNPQNYLGSYNSVPVGGVFANVISKNKLSKDNARGTYDYVFEGMHYGKPKSVDNQYYKEPWLSKDGKYGLKKVSRDNVVDLYKRSKKHGGNYTFGKGNAIYACDIGVGNCTDYHSYFMSLERTMGTPSRFHMGFPIPDGEYGKVGGYHCWADYYVENEGWYPVDISEADKAPEKKDYYFGTVDYNRVEMMVGRDFIIKGYEPEITNLFIYPLMEINDEQSSSYTKAFSYRNLD